MRTIKYKKIATLYSFILTILSFWIISESAGNEPYLTIRSHDIFTQVGISSPLITLWTILLFWLLYSIKNKHLNKTWFIIAVWAIIMQLFLVISIFSYFSDLTIFHAIK